MMWMDSASSSWMCVRRRTKRSVRGAASWPTRPRAPERRWASGGALALAGRRVERVRLAEVDEVVVLRVGLGQRLEVLQQRLHLRELDALEERGRRLVEVPLAAVQPDQPLERRRDAPRRHLRRD